MSRLFFLPGRTPFRLVKNRIWLFALTPSLSKASSAPGNNGGSIVVCGNCNTRELFYTEHGQRFSFTRKVRKIHMGFYGHLCPITLFRKFGISSQFFVDIHEKRFRISRGLISYCVVIISCFPDIFPKISPDSRRNFLWNRPLILDT